MISNENKNDIQSEINTVLKAVEGDFAIAYYNTTTKKTLLINENEVFHAASTMKTPIMMEIMHAQAQGKLKISDKILIKNEFKSIVDGSVYNMDLKDDSDDVIYGKINKQMSIEQLMFQMVTVSSNLATNILIEKVGANNVMAYLKSLKINNINVLRGVEDSKAFKQGLNNNTTAKALMDMFVCIETKKKLAGRAKMIEILMAQKFNEMIPALLPKGTKVAHKTGNITGVEHDGGIVYPAKGSPYVLIILSKNLKNPKLGVEAIAKVSKMVFDWHVTAK